MNYYELSSIELNRLKKKKIKNWLYYELKTCLIKFRFDWNWNYE